MPVAGIRAYDKVNDTSLRIGDYESLKEAAIDPYVAIRDAYVQYRLKKVNRKGGSTPRGRFRITEKMNEKECVHMKSLKVIVMIVFVILIAPGRAAAGGPFGPPQPVVKRGRGIAYRHRILVS